MNPRTVLGIAGLVAVILSSACVNTSMTSQMNRTAVTRPFVKIMVIGDFADLAYRDRAETRLCDDMALKTTAQCFRSLDYTPPGSFTFDDLLDAMAAIDGDGAVLLTATGTSITTAYVPETSRTTGSATIVGNTAHGQSTTQTYGGYNVSKPVAGFEVFFYANTDPDAVWYASAGAGGNAFHDWADLISATAGKTVSKLLEDGVLAPRKR